MCCVGRRGCGSRLEHQAPGSRIEFVVGPGVGVAELVPVGDGRVIGGGGGGFRRGVLEIVLGEDEYKGAGSGGIREEDEERETYESEIN